jgi:hypothetical protein
MSKITEIKKAAYQYAFNILIENARESEREFPPLSDITEGAKELTSFFSQHEDLDEAYWLLDQAFAYVNDQYYYSQDCGFDVDTARSIKNYIHHANELKTLMTA